MSALAITIAALKTIGGVTAITTTSRIYAMRAPQEASRPYVVVYRAGGSDRQLLDGPSRFFRHRVTVECVADGPDDMDALGNAVIGTGPTGGLPGISNASLAGSVATFQGPVSDIDFFSDAQGDGVCRRVLDFLVDWR